MLNIFDFRQFDVHDETNTNAPHWHVTFNTGQAQAAIERSASDYIDSTWWAALDRQPSDEEWHNRLAMLEAAQAQSAMSTMDTARGLNRALFQSVEYANRQRNDEEYVTDMYETYLLREADRGGFTYWLERLRSDNANGLDGRENLLNIFESSPEFVDLVTHLHGIVPPNICDPTERQQCISNGGVWDPDTCTCITDPDPCLNNQLICR